MGLTCNIEVFENNLRRYAVIAGKSIWSAVKEEALDISKRLTSITPPKSAKQGKKRIESDIKRVYLMNEWFLEKFQFKSTALGEKVKSAVRLADKGSLEEVFNRSAKFSRIHIENFNESIHKRFRRNGRVAKGVAPFSYPLSDQTKVTNFIKEKSKRAGLVKSGWAACVKALGGSVAKWTDKGSASGSVIQNEKEKYIILTNNIQYASSFINAYRAVLRGRSKELAKKTEKALKSIRW